MHVVLQETNEHLDYFQQELQRCTDQLNVMSAQANQYEWKDWKDLERRTAYHNY